MTHDGKPKLIHQTQALSHSGLLLGNAVRCFAAKRGADWACAAPGREEACRSVLYCATCYFYLMRSQAKSDPESAARFLNSELFCSVSLSPPLLTFCFIKSAQDHSISNRRTGNHFFSHILQSFQWWPFVKTIKYNVTKIRRKGTDSEFSLAKFRV